MPKIRVNGTELYYEDTGGSSKETIFFSAGVFGSSRIFDDQIGALSGRYRCVVYDHRGQGESEITQSGYDMETLSEDAAFLIQALDCAPVHFVGLSMGGFVGLRLGSRRQNLLKSLILLNSSSDMEIEQIANHYKSIDRTLKWFGSKRAASQIASVLFGKSFLNNPIHKSRLEEAEKMFGIAQRDGTRRLITSVCERRSVYEEINRITVPVLVVAGDEDVLIPLEQTKRIHHQIADSKYVLLDQTGHYSVIEKPDTISNLIQVFLNGLRQFQS
ncbi:MAG: alpha/beta hydrolase [Anaerolineae bacterium]|nr:alpha/beta hydrolase [Anaerolineae bacterium]MBN8617274.1 alpha/beta hydrolase [Anaerolineae bacterium]